jgi:ribosomal protein S18 acetylase RimI-like enzyme
MHSSTSAAGEPALLGRTDGGQDDQAWHRHGVSTSARAAGAGDVDELVSLINRAYAIEAAFLDGDRTSAGELSDLDARGDFLVLDRLGGGLAAAVYVRIDGTRGYLGMLSVAPDLQGLGLGRRLVALAEALCAARGCTVMDLQIINLREELGPWYRSLGYQEVGTAPYDHRGTKQPCHFVKMSKPLV